MSDARETLALPSGERVSLRHTLEWALERVRREAILGSKHMHS